MASVRSDHESLEELERYEVLAEAHAHLDHGRYPKARELGASIDVPDDILSLWDALGDLHRGEPPDWAAFERAVRFGSSPPSLACWPADWRLSEEPSVALIGDRPPEPDDAGTRLAPREDERSLFSIGAGDLSGAHGLAIHVLLDIEVALDQRLQLRGQHSGQDDEELLIFRNDGFTVAGRTTVPAPRSDGPRLYSIVVERGLLWLYVDGLLRFRRPRVRDGLPDGFLVDVYTSPQRQSVRLGGLSIEILDAPHRGWGLGDEPVEARLRQHVDRGEPEELFRLLHRVPGAAVTAGGDALLELLLEISEGDSGYQDWVVDELERHLPPNAKAAWDDLAPRVTPSPVITVEDLSVTFSQDPSTDRSLARFLRRLPPRRFEALSHLNFKIFQGDIVGIIGRNGAGKSTLLRTLTGAIPLSSGRARVEGTLALLRPGAGMREHLSGRQNIYNSGIYMGMSLRQIREIEQEVIEFSELGEAIDRPYKYYSDGMRSRLIFSLATSVSPEILMLDELLGAGDMSFQEKAMSRLERFIEHAHVVIVVQHGGDFVRRRCNKALYLEEGRQVYFGDPHIALDLYLNGVTNADTSDGIPA